MKINTGNEEIYRKIDPGAGLKNSVRAIHENRVGPSKNITRTIQNTAQARTLIDAMVISQIAQSVINRALNITSRLRDIARDALSSGRINSEKLMEAVSSTRASFQNMNEAFSPPAVSIPPVNTSAINNEHGTEIKIPELNIDTDILSALENKTNRGEVPSRADIQNLDSILENLKTNEAALKNNLVRIEAALEIDTGTAVNYEGMISSAADSISGNPGLALISQGNINPENARALF